MRHKSYVLTAIPRTLRSSPDMVRRIQIQGWEIVCKIWSVEFDLGI